MIIKVILGTIQNARKLVSIAEAIPYEAELCNGRYDVNAKSMLGVLSLSDFETGELHIHTDNEKSVKRYCTSWRRTIFCWIRRIPSAGLFMMLRYSGKS